MGIVGYGKAKHGTAVERVGVILLQLEPCRSRAECFFSCSSGQGGKGQLVHTVTRAGKKGLGRPWRCRQGRNFSPAQALSDGAPGGAAIGAAINPVSGAQIYHMRMLRTGDQGGDAGERIIEIPAFAPIRAAVKAAIGRAGIDCAGRVRIQCQSVDGFSLI